MSSCGLETTIDPPISKLSGFPRCSGKAILSFGSEQVSVCTSCLVVILSTESVRSKYQRHGGGRRPMTELRMTHGSEAAWHPRDQEARRFSEPAPIRALHREWCRRPRGNQPSRSRLRRSRPTAPRTYIERLSRRTFAGASLSSRPGASHETTAGSGGNLRHGVLDEVDRQRPMLSSRNAPFRERIVERSRRSAAR